MKNTLLFSVVVFLLGGCGHTKAEMAQAVEIQKLKSEIEKYQKANGSGEKAPAPEKSAKTDEAVSEAPTVRIIQPFSMGFEFYLGAPPFGWGGNDLSVQWTNDVPGCYMEVVIAGQPGRVLSSNDGALREVPGTIYTVADEGGAVHPASLIPPETTVYFLRDRPGCQNWTATCYIEIPRLTRVAAGDNTVEVPVLHAFRRLANQTMCRGGAKRLTPFWMPRIHEAY